MYTIRIHRYPKNYGEPDELRQLIEKEIRKLLSKINIEFDSINKFLGEELFWTIHGFQKKSGKKQLSYKNWVGVNQSINKVFDELKIVAHVRAENYIVRSAQRGAKL